MYKNATRRSQNRKQDCPAMGVCVCVCWAQQKSQKRHDPTGDTT